MNKNITKLASFTIGLITFVLALSFPLIISTIAISMELPTIINLGIYWGVSIAFVVSLVEGYFLKLSEGSTNLGYFIAIFVYAYIYTQDVNFIFIFALNSFIPLVFGLLGFKLGITARVKLHTANQV
ncbi:MAG: hypothetical protein JKX78_05060 [Alteromonadaceae bacterium]|nr:hypothetical protein [Alteromonadaceae bacterium]